MKEIDLQRAVMDLCKLYRLRVHHCRPARMQSGRWATPIEGDKGFPDLCITGAGGTLFVELKSAKGVLSPDQVSWLNTLEASGQDVAVWRPVDLSSGKISRILAALRHADNEDDRHGE